MSDITKLSAKKLHATGAELREKDMHEEAVIRLSLALIYYQKRKNYKGMVDVLKDRTLIWKHYFLLTNDEVYVVLAQKDAESMLEIAKEKELKDKISTSYFRLGEVSMLIKNYEDAIQHYKRSIKHYVGPESERGDFIYHLGEALYEVGKRKEGRQKLLEGLRIIQENKTEVDPFLIHVWESGAHMRIAFCLSKDEPKEAKKHFMEAKKIIELDQKLVIRRRQLKELKKKLSF